MNKLSEQDVTLILELVKTLPIKEVAEKFEVYPETIRYHISRFNAGVINGWIKCHIGVLPNYFITNCANKLHLV